LMEKHENFKFTSKSAKRMFFHEICLQHSARIFLCF
jgi:hypothetical protein